jgi:DNA invertase Pin-like site-specific DNA recombinase
MLTAYLYIRVSTDEQAVKGYSQRSQADRLTHYCKLNHFSIAQTIFEDFSAKTFNRPEWNKLYSNLKVLKNQSPIILFTYWDRFSRNITDAYHMLEQLRKIKVLIQAIEQPIDFSVPESKIMLAMYLATSEVENDKRSRNVSLGMQKARLEGKWINKAPIGYKNMITADGHKYIAPHEPEATIITESFENIIKQGSGNLFEIYKEAVKKGLCCSRSTFYHLVRSPVYCGKIIIPPKEKGKARIIEGQHKKIITVMQFEMVQKLVNDGISKSKRRVVKKSEEFILRGILICPICNKTLTASNSQGHSKKYGYYHCFKGCSYRIRTDTLNSQFVSFLKGLKAEDYFVRIYQVMLKDIYSEKQTDYSSKKHQIHREMNKLIDRSLNAQELFTKGSIDYDDYILIRENCKKSLNNYAKSMQEEALNLATGEFSASQQYVLLNHIGDLYENSGINIKERIVHLFFPTKVAIHKSGIPEMIREPIKIIFEPNKPNTNQCVGQEREKNEEMINFLKELIFIDFDNIHEKL